MIRPFRRSRPTPPQPSLSAHDAATFHAAGLTYTQWLNLTDQQRADLRWRVRV